MNGEQHSLAAAPLDLRTTLRERGSSGSTSPDTRVTGGSPAPPACTETDSLDKHIPEVKVESCGARKRACDKPALILPFRKRKITVEQTENSDSSPPTAQDTEWSMRAPVSARHVHDVNGYKPSVPIWHPFTPYGKPVIDIPNFTDAGDRL